MDTSEMLARTQKILTERLGITFRTGGVQTHQILHRINASPAGAPIVTEAMHKGQVIGKTAVIPMKAESEGRSFTAGMSMESEVSSKYRGFGVFPILVNECIKTCGDQGIEYIYGFPNENSFENFIKYCGFKLIGTVPLLAKPMLPIAPAQRVLRSHLAAKALMGILRPVLAGYRLGTTMGAIAASCASEAPNGFTSSEQIWSATSQERPLHMVRDKAFMDWRYGGDEYIRLECTDPKTGARGQAAISIRDKERYRIGFICELMTDSSDKGVTNRLLREAEKRFVRAGADIACSLTMPGTQMYNALRKAGYLKLPPSLLGREFWYIGRNLVGPDDNRTEIFENWLLTLSDFDVA